MRNEKENGNKSQDVSYYLGYTFLKQGRFFDAINIINSIDVKKVEVIRRDAFEDNLLYLKGRILLELKRYDESINCYKKLIVKEPEKLDYKYKLACVYGLNNRQQEAIDILEDINKETPGMLYIVKKLGHAYDQIKDYKKARAYFNYSLRLDPNDYGIKKRLEEYDKFLRFI